MRSCSRQIVRVRKRTSLKARYPKAVDCLAKDQERLLAFFDFPAEHWVHLRTTNPIESPFATVKTRTRQTKGAGSRKAGLALACQLILATQKRWRLVNAPHLVALVREGVVFRDGEQVVSQPIEKDDLVVADVPMRIAA